MPTRFWLCSHLTICFVFKLPKWVVRRMDKLRKSIYSYGKRQTTLADFIAWRIRIMFVEPKNKEVWNRIGQLHYTGGEGIWDGLSEFKGPWLNFMTPRCLPRYPFLPTLRLSRIMNIYQFENSHRMDCSLLTSSTSFLIVVVLNVLS